MILSDNDIITAVARDVVDLDPWRLGQLNPASYDLTLGPELLVAEWAPPWSSPYGRLTAQPLDLADVASQPPYLKPVNLRYQHADGDAQTRPYTMQPGEFLLASTVERVTLPTTVAARVEGKSSLARVGLSVHVTGGFIDPGFSGQITLEMVNMLHRPLILHAGMRIAQIAFMLMNGAVVKSYARSGRYQNQSGPTLSRFKIEKGNPAK